MPYLSILSKNWESPTLIPDPTFIEFWLISPLYINFIPYGYYKD